MRKYWFILVVMALAFSWTRPYKVQENRKPHIDTVEKRAVIPFAYYDLIRRTAVNNDIPLYIAANLAREESAFRHTRVNTRNYDRSIDAGLYQANSKNWSWFGDAFLYGEPFKPLNAEHSTVACLGYLRTLYNRFGDWELALIAYNAGPTRVAAGNIPKESIAFARKILDD